MKYLHLFDTQADFESAYNGEEYDEPWVGLVKANNHVSYNKLLHEYIEIGGKKWATMNIGAENPWDYGLYFQWADISGYTLQEIQNHEKNFAQEDYKYSDIYGNVNKYDDEDNYIQLETMDDGVYYAWRKNWRVPTYNDWQELATATTTAWTSDYENTGIPGVIFTDNIDSSKTLFFPANGAIFQYNTGSAGRYGAYWTDERNDGNPQSARYMKMQQEGIFNLDLVRWCGMGLRGILNEG